MTGRLKRRREIVETNKANRPQYSEAERALRARLVDRREIDSIHDDQSLLNYLKSLRKPTEDPRNQWERELTDRLEAELAEAA